MIDPEVFILGGGVSKAGQFLVDRVQGYLKKLYGQAEETLSLRLQPWEMMLESMVLHIPS